MTRRCECGERIVKTYAGRRLDVPGQPVQTWCECANGHATGVQRIPENLGSRA